MSVCCQAAVLWCLVAVRSDLPTFKGGFDLARRRDAHINEAVSLTFEDLPDYIGSTEFEKERFEIMFTGFVQNVALCFAE